LKYAELSRIEFVIIGYNEIFISKYELKINKTMLSFNTLVTKKFFHYYNNEFGIIPHWMG